MGIIKEFVFGKNNYTKIRSVEIDYNRQEARIRTTVYKDMTKKHIAVNTIEYCIDKKRLTDISIAEAETTIDNKKFHTALKTRISNKETLVGKKLLKKEKDKIELALKCEIISSRQTVLGKEKIISFFCDLDNIGVRATCYNILKTLPEFKDCKDT